ncbi:AlpA family transcriptional regulator [Glaciihabitans sp. dw_435]|uniref:helix-turn-helix transcriptional regulator n=1 Tax=Glaciihabitans sp. dw_435 TaxID=2720081 RepID=UPI001BD33D7E|nr:helix-turn-helix domain-containing protein [Glaciihabitans sp. dw_435]
MEYNARIEFAERDSDDAADRLVTALEPFSPAAGVSVDGHLEVVITLYAADVRQATASALALAGEASTSDVLALEVMTTAAFDRRRELTPMPELVDATGAAEILGISRQAVGKKLDAGQLPGRRIGERGMAFPRADLERIALIRGSRFEEAADRLVDALRDIQAVKGHSTQEEYLDPRN